MRIIAGQHRGRRLQALPGTATRPTSDKLRETLFNVIAPWIEDSVFIDAYAGSGAVGLEALSRRARQVHLIESNAAACHLIEANLAFLPSRQQVCCWRMTVSAALQRMAAQQVQADICFLDPPYSELAAAVDDGRAMVAAGIMRPSGWIIVEHDKRDGTPESIGMSPEQWQRARLLTQGSSALSFYRLAPSAVRPGSQPGSHR